MLFERARQTDVDERQSAEAPDRCGKERPQGQKMRRNISDSDQHDHLPPLYPNPAWRG